MKTRKKKASNACTESQILTASLSDFPSLLSTKNRKVPSTLRSLLYAFSFFFFFKRFSRFSFSLLLFHSWSSDFAFFVKRFSPVLFLCCSNFPFLFVFFFFFCLDPARFDSVSRASFFRAKNTRIMARADDDPDVSDPYFFVIDFGCGPTNFRSRRGGLSSNSEAASPLQHET